MNEITPSLIHRREQLKAEQLAQKFPELFVHRNLVPAFKNYYATFDEALQLSLFIAELDTARLGDHARYVDPDLLHQIGFDLGGLQVYLSNSIGLCYVIPLSTLPKLPRSIELPHDIPIGMLALGVKFNSQPILIPFSKLGHLLIAGMTGSGKSSLLRSIAIQAIRNGIQLALADIDQTTFAMLEGNQNLFAPIATTPQSALDLIMKILGECDHRAAMYKSMPGFPENIDEHNALAVKAGKEPLNRIIVMLDESSAVLKAMGGGSGELAGRLAELTWRGRKFGVHFIFGGQDFSKELLGPLREQVNLSIAFRVRPTSALMAKKLGCENAHRIPADRPGLAIVDRFGPVQSYFVPKQFLISAGSASTSESLSALEKQLFSRALSEGGRLSRVKVIEWGGVTEWQARKSLEAWALRGWVVKDPKADNAFVITEKIGRLLSNHPAAPATSNPLQPAPAVLES